VSRAESRNIVAFRASVLVCFGFVLASLLGEAVTRVAFRSSRDLDMEMWRYATLLKRESGDAALGHVHASNRDVKLMGVRVTTNAQGMRDGPVAEPKPANEYRIMVLGDSFTMGWGTPQDQTFVSQLERRLNAWDDAPPDGRHYRVLNLGVGNYNTSQEVALFRSIGMALQPDLLVLAYFINDAEPLVRKRTPWLVRHSYLAAMVASRIRRLPFGPSPLKDYATFYRNLYRPQQQGWQATQNALQDLAADARRLGVPALVVLIPELHDLKPPYAFSDINDLVTQAGRRAGLEVFDLFPAFSGRSPEASLWVTAEDAHPNAAAHAIIADAVLRALVDAGLPGESHLMTGESRR